jgi:hypothetical protein
MERQLFVVALEVPPAFGRYFPRVEAERMAVIIRDGVRAKSCSFMGPVPFKITIERADEVASANGEMHEYVPGDFDESPEELVRSFPLKPEGSIIETK